MTLLGLQSNSATPLTVSTVGMVTEMLAATWLALTAATTATARAEMRNPDMLAPYEH